jgi:hypothetical protein
MADLLPVPYFHVVFTLPDTLNVLLPADARVFYGLLFRAARQALLHLAGKHLGREPGVVAVLHTWGQTLWLHPHLHCIVTGGALSAAEFIRRFLLHVLPTGFRKIRFGGFLGSPAKSAKQAACRALLPAPAPPENHATEAAPPADPDPLLLCPRCGRGTMRPAGALPADAAAPAQPSPAGVPVQPVPFRSGAGPPELRHAA